MSLEFSSLYNTICIYYTKKYGQPKKKKNVLRKLYCVFQPFYRFAFAHRCDSHGPCIGAECWLQAWCLSWDIAELSRHQDINTFLYIIILSQSLIKMSFFSRFYFEIRSNVQRINFSVRLHLGILITTGEPCILCCEK